MYEHEHTLTAEVQVSGQKYAPSKKEYARLNPRVQWHFEDIYKVWTILIQWQ